MIKKFLYILIFFTALTNMLGHILNNNFLVEINNIIRIAPSPIIASLTNDIEMHTLKSHIIVNKHKRINLSHYWSLQTSCSHKQLATEFVIFQHKNLLEKGIKGISYRLFCKKSCMKSIIEDKENLKIEEFEFNINHQGNNYYARSKCKN